MRKNEMGRRAVLALTLCAGCLSGLAFETDSLKPFPLSRPLPADLGPGKRGFQACPSVTASPKGRLWATWMTGRKTEDNENAIVVATSSDGGKTWSAPLFAIDCPGPLRALDPGLWTDPDGKVWLFWGQIYNFWDGRAGLWTRQAVDPEREDTAWTEPRRLCDGYMKNKPTVLKNGDWLFPIEFMPYDHCLQGETMYTMKPVPQGTPFTHPSDTARLQSVYVSFDKGQTLAHFSTAATARKDRCYPENMIVERKDGSLWMLGRLLYGIGETTSADGGRTWAPMKPSRFVAPNARFFVRRLRSGALLLVKNGETCVSATGGKCARDVMKAFVSDDDGRTWTGGLTLDSRKDVSYPDGCETADGFIHVVHDREREDAREIWHHRFTEADVRAGRLVTPGSSLLTLVNNATR